MHLEVAGGRAATNLMSGPVAVGEGVRAAMAAPPLSHRSAEFATLMDRVRECLLNLLGVNDVLVMPGSGTLANDTVGHSSPPKAARGWC